MFLFIHYTQNRATYVIKEFLDYILKLKEDNNQYQPQVGSHVPYWERQKKVVVTSLEVYPMTRDMG